MRQTVVRFSQTSKLEKSPALFHIVIDMKATWQTCIEMLLQTEEAVQQPQYSYNAFEQGQTELHHSLEKWNWSMPQLISDCDLLNHTYRQSYTDLAALRLRAPRLDGSARLVAAGLPWFMTLFSRDTLITSYQTLLCGPNLAIGALRALARWQGTQVDDFRDEEPGKILHEMRVGELGDSARFGRPGRMAAHFSGKPTEGV